MQIGKEKESQESMESRKPSEETVPREWSDELSVYIDTLFLFSKLAILFVKCKLTY